MTRDRRTLLKSAGALALGVAAAPAAAATPPSTAALTAAGLDPLATYRRMFASAANGAESLWWYFGFQPIDVPDVGPVPTGQVATLMGYLTEDLGQGAFAIHWLEIGTFRDIATGAPATPWPNPITGAVDQRRPGMEDGPGRYTLRKSGSGLTIALDQTRATVRDVRVDATVVGDRVCLTQTEDKERTFGGNTQAIRTTLKIYASLADLRGTAGDVPARGFYSVLLPATGKYSVTGLMEKTAMDEKRDPVAWERMKAAYPGWFKGDRFAPNWKR